MGSSTSDDKDYGESEEAELSGLGQGAVEDVLDAAGQGAVDSTTPSKRRLGAGRRARVSFATLIRVSGYCGAASPSRLRPSHRPLSRECGGMIAFASHKSGL